MPLEYSFSSSECTSSGFHAMDPPLPLLSLGVTSAVVSSYGHDSGQVEQCVAQ